MLRFVCALAAVSMLGFTASDASATSCCEVLRTPDGFLALRKGPRPDAPLVRKVPSGRDICFGTERPKIPHPPSWDYGMFVDEARVPHWGWVNRRFLSKQCG